MVDNVSVYNLNTNKALLDDLNNQMSTRKKINDPTKDPVTAVSSLRYRGSLSEYTQYLGKNVTDAASWTDSTRAAIDTAKELMRSLKAEYTSASNGTNENTDRWTYYDNMVNVVNEYFSVGDTTNENRYLFSGARTGDSLTFSEKNFDDRFKAVTEGMSQTDIDNNYPDKFTNTYKYAGITEEFDIEDIESYGFTARQGKTGTDGASGVTDQEISSIETTDTDEVNETKVQNVEAYRIRLAYEKLDESQDNVTYGYKYVDKDGKIQESTETTNVRVLVVKDKNGNDVDISADVNCNVHLITNDYEINQDSLSGEEVFLNTTTGNLIFGQSVQAKLSECLNSGYSISFEYNKSAWEEGDAKPEHYFKCVDVGPGTDASQAIGYNLYYDTDGVQQKSSGADQEIYYNVGEGMQIRVNSKASDAFTLDARRDLNELRDALTAWDNARSKVERLKEMQNDTTTYGSDVQEKITYLLQAAEKETEYAKEKVDTMLSNGITRSGNYFDVVNLAGTEMGTSINRLNLIRNRLTEHQSTTTAQASDNENIDISTVAVEVNAATISFSAALQVTGKISQQSLVNFL